MTFLAAPIAGQTYCSPQVTCYQGDGTALISPASPATLGTAHTVRVDPSSWGLTKSVVILRSLAAGPPTPFPVYPQAGNVLVDLSVLLRVDDLAYYVPPTFYLASDIPIPASPALVGVFVFSQAFTRQTNETWEATDCLVEIIN